MTVGVSEFRTLKQWTTNVPVKEEVEEGGEELREEGKKEEEQGGEESDSRRTQNSRENEGTHADWREMGVMRDRRGEVEGETGFERDILSEERSAVGCFGLR